MNELTGRQKQVLKIIAAHLQQQGYPPSVREIAASLGVKNVFGVQRHLHALEKKGFLARSEGSSRAIRLTPAAAAHHPPVDREEAAVHLPIVGTVRAGMPQPPLEDIEETYSIDRHVARTGGTFFLRVRGDSMINAAIREGDLALIRPQAVAGNRDIVVAMVNGEATLKRFYREAGAIRLQPENPNYPPIIISGEENDITIIGKVVGIYRPLE
jgi:repressor LexA